MWAYVTKLSVFAEVYIVPELTKVVDGVATVLADSAAEVPVTDPEYSTIAYAFENLPPSSRMLDHLAKTYYTLWIHDNHDEYLRDYPEKLPTEFHHRVMHYVLHNHGK